MTLSVSPQMRLVALLSGVAALGLAVFMLLGRSSPGSTQATLTPAERSAMHAKSRHKPRATPAPKRVAPHQATPKPKPAPTKPAHPAIAVLPGLPPDLASSLRRHELVVVSIYDPQARVDRISLAEAAAGASVAHAGFVPLNVLDQRQAGPLMSQLGVLPDPAVLVYQRPGKLVARFDGFADRDTVAQAVTNAMPAELARQATEQAAAPKVSRPPAIVTLAAWATRASKTCARLEAGTQKIQRGASRSEFLTWGPTMLAAEQDLIAGLTALPLPTNPQDRALAQRLIDAAKRYRASEGRLYVAVKRNTPVAQMNRLIAAEDAVITEANAAARAAGATGCAIFSA